MAEAAKKPVPEAWIRQEVNVRYTHADVPRRRPDCTLEKPGERGVRVVADEKTTFFPWSSVTKIGSTYSGPAQLL